MGDEIKMKGGVTLEAFLPSFAEIRLLKNGKVILNSKKAQALTYVTREPGVYRIEAYRNYLGVKRGWIFSNPIYVR
jgi:predicted transcriptional regulator